MIDWKIQAYVQHNIVLGSRQNKIAYNSIKNAMPKLVYLLFITNIKKKKSFQLRIIFL